MRVRPAQATDLDQWLEIAREVEPLFGPMPDLAEHVDRAIARGTALVVADETGMHGACLLSRDDVEHMIHWLAVRASSRRQGCGSAMLRAIADRWPDGNISVITFTASIPEGDPARRLYEAHGYEPRGPAAAAADGGERELYVLPAAKRLRR